MAYLGLSILVVSISYLCYKHPPTSWIVPRWFRLASSRSLGRSKDAPERNTDHDRQTDLKDTPQIIHSPPVRVGIPQITHDEPREKAVEDRKAMPPPPPPPRPSPPSSSFEKPKTLPKPPAVPSLLLNSSTEEAATKPSRPAAMFPALNSAQRASGGTNAPPRLPPAGSNSNLMAPPSRPISSLPNRGPPTTQTSSSSLFPPPSHTTIPSKPSKKVLLAPGHSPLDWARLTTSPSFPACSAYIRVPPSLLKTMNGRKGKDAWTVLGGKVYNITPYMGYHPGGVPELMRCAGREGTRLFAEVHPWVNWEGMLEACLVGIAVEEPVAGRERGSGLEDMD